MVDPEPYLKEANMIDLTRRADIIKINSLSEYRGIFVCVNGLEWAVQFTDEVKSDSHFVPILKVEFFEDLNVEVYVVINKHGAIGKFRLSLQDFSAVAPDYEVSDQKGKKHLESIVGTDVDYREVLDRLFVSKYPMVDLMRSQAVVVTSLSIDLWDWYMPNQVDKKN